MDKEEARQLFSEWLARQARGTLDQDATAAFAEVVERVSALGKKGKLVLEVLVEPAGSGGRTVALGGRVTTKAPLPDPELGIFYIGVAGTLHRDDPFQKRLPGIPYVDTAGETKVVDEATGEIRKLEEVEEPPRPIAEG